MQHAHIFTKMTLRTALTKVTTMVYLGVGMLARDVAAIMPGRAVQVMEVRPMPAQAVGGVPDTLKASVKATTATAAPPKCLYGSLFTAVGTQAVVAASVSLATGSAIAGGAAVLLSGTMVDAATVSTDPTGDDEKACTEDVTKPAFLAGVAATAVAIKSTVFKKLNRVKEVDEVCCYVYACGLAFWASWQGLVGVVNFMFSL